MSMRSIRIAMVQMNAVVGDLNGNVRAMVRWMKEARKGQADLVVFPELAITGYPPEDLLLRPSFLKDARMALKDFIAQCGHLTAVVGCVEEGKPALVQEPKPVVVPSGRRRLYNAAAVIQDRKLVATYHKAVLPDYGVFDESRYFYPGNQALVCVIGGVRVGINICEDIWYEGGPIKAQMSRGKVELIVNINASPFHKGKSTIRERLLRKRARENHVPISYTNMVGGQDEIVFDGNSILMDPQGRILGRGKAFDEDMIVADVECLTRQTRTRRPTKQDGKKFSIAFSVKTVMAPWGEKHRPKKPLEPRAIAKLNPVEEIYVALVTGVRDYVRKNRFSHVVIGMSGGVDSALTAVIATDALGAERVTGVLMPSTFTSQESKEDATTLMKTLHCQWLTLPITQLWRKYLSVLAPIFKDRPFDQTEENLQARIRGTLLMALSNKFGWLVLTTGNKSEMSVGYATLYGDMAGGFAVIKDVPKLLVYELAHFRNARADREEGRVLIPERILTRAPSAELKPNQTDQDVLPPYEVLDKILEAYVEQDRSYKEIVKLGFKATTVRQVMTMVDRSEYKRRQAPIGIKITSRALGKDRRMPITNHYMKY